MSSATSTIDIYKHCKLLKDKNFILDGSGAQDYTSSYLGTLEKKTITGFQYIKHALSITIKVDLNQDYFQMKSSANDWNYVRIRNSEITASDFYYFVDHFEWGSENTAKIYLIMDTINTFKYNKDYKVNKKTLVKREHKDRFIDMYEKIYHQRFYLNKTSPYATETFFIQPFLEGWFDSYATIEDIDVVSTLSYSGSYVQSATIGSAGLTIVIGGTGTGNVVVDVDISCQGLEKIVDLQSEEIFAPLYKTSEETLLANKGDESVDWRLYYRNSSSPNDPIDCYLLPDTPTQINAISSDGYIPATSLSNDGYYYIMTTYNSFTVGFLASSDYLYPVESISTFGSAYKIVVLEKTNNAIDIYYLTSTGYTLIVSGLTNIHILSDSNTIHTMYSSTQVSYDDMAGIYYKPSYATRSLLINYSASDYVISDDLDKTQSYNIKVIDLPYSPTNFPFVNGSYRVRTPWFYDSVAKMLKLSTNKVPFSNDVESGTLGIYNQFVILKQGLVLDGTATRYLDDPKLLHSDFYRFKFVYDNFVKVFPFEQLEFNPNASLSFNFNFKASRNLTSKFLFTFNEILYKFSMEDYDKILVVARNNEEVLYSSQYLDYVRNGYNYDLKAKERSERVSAYGIGASALTMGASALFSATPLGIATLTTSAVSLTSQIINYAQSVAQNEESVARKLQESKNQAISVLNNDDLDLFKAYSNNRAKICVYEVSTKMKNVLNDLFYYAGYSVNEQKIPNVSSRYWFNFLQASLEVSETNNISEECMNDIKEKFEQGVTFLHFHLGFDFNQEKENLEVDLVTP